MKGYIAQYSKAQGKGIIIDENKTRRLFIDKQLDPPYNSPGVGDIVEFHPYAGAKYLTGSHIRVIEHYVNQKAKFNKETYKNQHDSTASYRGNIP